MKTFEKVWQSEYEGIKIEVRNFWNLERMGETVCINGQTVYRRDVPIGSIKLSSMMRQWLEFEENGVRITVRIGSAWHLCGMACQILINGRYHGGNRIVLFAKKS
ncbi:hypothetical protein [Neisseria dumasiana]|uniref:Uncharacterized protein n=1 Tax=Neisseria dumasiana TaxID=1931275 RepID=A0A1X3D5C6_9NEIS|nr:hypothetical protein [Neisseria dumasiana]OSI15123.1 hypothetical protein BV912_12190 [Neisseria dumasiana]